MSGGPTPRERLAVLETLMKNHIHTHDVRDKWLLGIISGLVVGFVLHGLPGFLSWLSGVL
ncbi:MAG: hypothetical protein ACYTF1_22015 [Planctomycetota bacterium]|jgi:hypothetical protein